MKAGGWILIVFTTFGLLLSVLFYHFDQALSWQVVLSSVIFGIMFCIGLLALRQERQERDQDVAAGDSSLGTTASVWQMIENLLQSIEKLPDQAPEAQAQIDDPIRTTYNQVARWLADHPGFLGTHQVEVQTTLGDLMNAIERVWTTLADGHPNAARAAYDEALGHVQRVRGLFPVGEVTV